MSHLDDERPEDLRTLLGEPRVAGAPNPDFLASIQADLEKQQGPHRSRSFFAKTWPLILAGTTSVAVFIAVARNFSQVLPMAAAALAVVASLVSYVALGITPGAPSDGEKWATVSLVVGAASLLIQPLIVNNSGAHSFGLQCTGMIIAATLIPLLWVILFFRRSGFPLRVKHCGAVTISTFSFSAAAIWLHCPSSYTWHVGVGHILVPCVVAALSSVGIFAWLNRNAR